MKLSLRLKLFFSYAGIILVTMVTLGWSARYLFNQHFEALLKRYGGLPPRPTDGGPGLSLFLETIESSLVYTTLAAGIVAIVLSLLISVIVTRPIKEVIDATKAIAKGNYDRRVQVHADDELGELSVALNTMAASLKENQKRQEELVSTLVHELATPLTSINGYLEAMNDGLIAGEQSKATLRLVKEEAERLSSMVKEVRELSQLQSPSFTIHPKKIRLHELVEKVLAQMKPQLKDKNLKVQFESTAPKQELPLDKDRLIQVLQNVLGNAIQYSPEGTAITLALHKKGKRLELSIQDEGPGIAAEDLPHLFKRFYRADRSRSRKTGGLGIGLAVVKEVMDAHKGRIHVDSTPGKGSTFTLSFPLN